VLDDACKFPRGAVGVSSPWGVGRDGEDPVGALVRFELEMPRYGSRPLEFAIGTEEAALATPPTRLLRTQRIGRRAKKNISRTAIICQSEVFEDLERLKVWVT